MSTPSDEAQRELERRALRNVRQLVEKLENTDEADEKSQKRLLAASGKLRLVGVNRHVQDVFRYSGFDQIFEIEGAG